MSASEFATTIYDRRTLMSACANERLRESQAHQKGSPLARTRNRARTGFRFTT